MPHRPAQLSTHMGEGQAVVEGCWWLGMKTVGKIPIPFYFQYLPCGTKKGYIGNKNEWDKYGNRKMIRFGRVNAKIEREPIL